MSVRYQRRRSLEPFLEVRLEPGDPRWQHRTWRMEGLRGGLQAAALLAYVLFLLVNVVLTIPVAASLLIRREYEGLISERTVQGDRLQSLLQTLGEAGERSEALHTRLLRIRLAYGLQGDASAASPAKVQGSIEAPASIYAGVISRGAADAAVIDERLAEIGPLLEEVEAHERDQPRSVQTTPSISPIAGSSFILTSAFGSRRNPFTKQIDLHAGIDLAAPVGTPIRAPADGVVAFAGRYQLRVGVAWWRFGNMVALRSGDRFITLFGHCDEIRVRRGRTVRQGEIVATVGNSGWSTNPHLHYEVRVADESGTFRPVDPRLFVFDHSWQEEDQILLRSQTTAAEEFEPLPRAFRR